ncbi:TRAP transporter substrate-binding protein DctP [Afifella sp. IM 167]|uniref:TRAP transporter substrate-binding protein DctP n=1 Tax=Afifella sp. IM 167 TaxID=2033586 RepID=UPI001CCD32D0|nr:TRAP transporter substrate-binding protein DctP [Afifella sp. IM 167]
MTASDLALRGRATMRAALTAVFLALAAASISPAAAAGLKAGMVGPGSPSEVKSFHRRMLERLKEAANEGETKIAIDLSPADAGGTPAELRAALSSGRIDIAALPLAASAAPEPALAAALLPGLVRSLARAERLNGSAFGRDLRARAEEAGLVVIADAWLSGGHASAGACLTGPAAVAGKTLHAEAPALRTILIKAGAAVAETPRSRLADAMAGGVLDGIFASSETLLQDGIAEAAKCLTAPGEETVFISYEPLVIAKPAWDGLSQDEQKALKAAGAKAAEMGAEEAKALQAKLVETYRAAGVEVQEMGRAEFDQWLAVAKESAFRDFLRDSPDGKKLIDEAISLD